MVLTAWVKKLTKTTLIPAAVACAGVFCVWAPPFVAPPFVILRSAATKDPSP